MELVRPFLGPRIIVNSANIPNGGIQQNWFTYTFLEAAFGIP